jgi:hypothetical protein
MLLAADAGATVAAAVPIMTAAVAADAVSLLILTVTPLVSTRYPARTLPRPYQFKTQIGAILSGVELTAR